MAKEGYVLISYLELVTPQIKDVALHIQLGSQILFRTPTIRWHKMKEIHKCKMKGLHVHGEVEIQKVTADFCSIFEGVSCKRKKQVT